MYTFLRNVLILSALPVAVAAQGDPALLEALVQTKAVHARLTVVDSAQSTPVQRIVDPKADIRNRLQAVKILGNELNESDLEELFTFLRDRGLEETNAE